MAIYIITGKPGQGKTYMLAKRAEEFYAAGRRIFSNFKLSVPDYVVGDIENDHDLADKSKQVFYWGNLSQFNRMDNGVILMDEAQRYFNARQWAFLSSDIEIKLQQHRKERLDLWGTTQHYSRIDVSLRLLVEEYFVVQKIIGNWRRRDGRYSRPWGVFRMRSYFLEDMDRAARAEGEGNKEKKIKHHQSTEWSFMEKDITSFYDTEEVVVASKPMPLKCVVRTAPCGHVEHKHI